METFQTVVQKNRQIQRHRIRKTLGPPAVPVRRAVRAAPAEPSAEPPPVPQAEPVNAPAPVRRRGRAVVIRRASALGRKARQSDDRDDGRSHGKPRRQKPKKRTTTRPRGIRGSARKFQRMSQVPEAVVLGDLSFPSRPADGEYRSPRPCRNLYRQCGRSVSKGSCSS